MSHAGNSRTHSLGTESATSAEVAVPVHVRVPVHARDLKPADLPSCSWAGSATHMVHVGRELGRAASGEVDYLAVCTPADVPVAIGGVDYAPSPGAGTLWQLGVVPALQSCGLGTVLILALEERVRSRGLARAELAVEESNRRARALYERLGYAAYGRRPESWDEEAPDGSLRRYETMCTLMRKPLP